MTPIELGSLFADGTFLAELPQHEPSEHILHNGANTLYFRFVVPSFESIRQAIREKLVS